MIVKMFVVYDSKSESYGQPFFAQATGSAIRAFSDDANARGEKSMVSSHPEDFTLFEIGTYNHTDGTIGIYEAKKSLGCAIDFVRCEMKAV